MKVEDASSIAHFAAIYTDRSRAFVVYKHGTIVFSDTRLPRSDGDYDATLLGAVAEVPSFTVQQMRLGNFIVSFKGPVIGLVLGDFYTANRDVIRREVDQGALLPGEEIRLENHSPTSQDRYYIGLYARSKLYCDTRTLEIDTRFVPGVTR